MVQTNIKLGYIRDPESHEMYFPHTHYLGVVGLDDHVLDLVGGEVPTKLSDLTNNILTLNGSTATPLSWYAPTSGGTSGQFLKSNGNAAPTWTALSLSDLSLYSKKLSYKLNSSTATELGTIIRNANDDLTLPEFYAPTTAGTIGQILKSTAGTPTWSSLENIIGKKASGQVLAGNGTGSSDSNVSWRTLSISDLGLYNKTLALTYNGSSHTIGNVIRNEDSDLTLSIGFLPNTVGTQYDLLMSNGSGAPSWLNFGNSNGYLKKTSNGWSLIGESNFFFPNEDVWFHKSLPTGTSASDIGNNGIQPSGIELNFYGGDGIILKQVKNASNHILGVQINASPIVSQLQTLSTNENTGYLKKTAADTWTLDPYGGSSNSSTDAAGNQMPFYDSSVTGSTMAGLKSTTSAGTTYQKISFAAITNDTATGNNAVTIILNGNFS